MLLLIVPLWWPPTDSLMGVVHVPVAPGVQIQRALVFRMVFLTLIFVFLMALKFFRLMAPCNLMVFLLALLLPMVVVTAVLM